jgi:integrase/recombinase XerD
MKVYLEPHEVESIEQQTTCLRDRLLIRLLFRLGCRVSEALSVRVSDIDFGQGTVTILHLKGSMSLSCSKCKARLGRHHRFCPRCGEEITEAVMRQQERRRMRTLPLDGDTLDMLTDFVRGRDRNSAIFGINRHRAWQIVRECARRAGIQSLHNPETGRTRDVSPHRLRDAFAVHAMKLDNSGDGLRLLQEHLGHAGFNTTAKYRKVAGDELRQWYQKLWSKVR